MKQAYNLLWTSWCNVAMKELERRLQNEHSRTNENRTRTFENCMPAAREHRTSFNYIMNCWLILNSILTDVNSISGYLKVFVRSQIHHQQKINMSLWNLEIFRYDAGNLLRRATVQFKSKCLTVLMYLFLNKVLIMSSNPIFIDNNLAFIEKIIDNWTKNKFINSNGCV